MRPRRTGLALVYAGPDSDGRRTEIPHSRLLQVIKDGTLGDGIEGLSNGASDYLARLYVSSLRDIRRTYQRAFKALLFAHRFELAAAERPTGPPSSATCSASRPFAGTGFARVGPGLRRTAGRFRLRLPAGARRLPPARGRPRAQPSPQRDQAMFDWWERLFDYTVPRADVRRRDRHLWHLFAEAQEKQPADPGYLLRHIGAAPATGRSTCATSRPDVPVYAVTSADLEDERWALRAWHADRWLAACGATSPRRTSPRPGPTCGRPTTRAASAGQTTGNANLLAFVCDGCLADAPRRMDDLRA